MTFCERIEKICREKGMTVSYMLDKCGISSAIIKKWREGSVPRPATIKKIADYLGVHPSFLLGEGDAPILTDNAQNTAVESIGDIEREIILLCKGFTMQQKNALLTRAYEIRDNK